LALEDIEAINRGVVQVQHELEEGIHRDLVHRCLRAQTATAWRLGIYYDLMPWESDIVRNHLLEEAYALIKQSPEVYEPTEGKFKGCVMMRMGDFLPGEGGAGDEEGEHTIDKVLVRSNGIPTYTGKDIAYHFWKYGLLEHDLLYREDTVQPNGQPLLTSAPDGAPRPRFQPTDVVNVIAVHQEYPQQVVAAALKVTGHEEQYRGFHHLSYGLVDILQDGVRVKQSGRGGTGLATDDVIDQAAAVCYEISAAKWGTELSDDELRDIAETLGTAAVRYVLCQFNPLKDIVFDIATVSKPEGNTGPYLQYAYTRTQAILRRAREEKGVAVPAADGAAAALLSTPAERELITHLARLPDVVHDVAATLAVNALADYGYTLATLFTQFYDRCPVLRAESDELMRARLSLVVATAQVMRNAFGLLGLSLRDRL
jgi:arginyl-tRNA synthetase